MKDLMKIKDENLEMAVTQFLQSMKLQANLSGYKLIRTAILYAVEQPELSFSLTDLYDRVADVYRTGRDNVERAIRNVITTAYDKDPDALREAFYYPVDKPSNSELIALAVDHIRIYNGSRE